MRRGVCDETLPRKGGGYTLQLNFSFYALCYIRDRSISGADFRKWTEILKTESESDTRRRFIDNSGNLFYFVYYQY